MNFRRILKLTLLLMPLVFVACSQRHYFKIDAISGGELSLNESYYLVSGNPDIKENDLRFKEVATYVNQALGSKKMKAAQSIQNADILIEITFEMGDARERMDVRHEAQTYWQPGYSFSVSVPVVNSSGSIIGYRQRIVSRPPRSHTYWDEYLDATTVYDKELVITAYDNQMSDPASDPTQLWSVSVKNEDFSDELRVYLPYMVAAAMPYMGYDSKEPLRVSISEENQNLQLILHETSIEK